MLDSFTYGNGVTHKTTLYSDSLLPKQLKDTGPAGSNLPSTVMALTYDYDNNANITSIIDGQNSAHSLTYLGYDDLDRLTSTTGGTGIGSSTLRYDGFGNITYYKNKGKTLNYTYDYAKNRLSKITGVSGRYGSIGYDSRGNITNNGAYSLAFNAANQLTTAKGNSYLYDGHNRRVKQTDGNGISYSMYSQDGMLLYREKGSTITGNGTNYIYLGKKLIAKYGNVTPQTVNESRQHTRPFGETIEAPKDDVGYTGHKFDTDLGLSYMQARYYDPVIGRFYSNDPVGFRDVHSFNRYVYANNNPYKYIDPDGRSSIPGFQLTPYDTGVGPTGTQNLTTAQRLEGINHITGYQDLAESVNSAMSGNLGAAAMSMAGFIAKPIKLMTITSKQLGKKLGRHVQDFGGDPSSAADRQSVVDKINDIANNPDKVVKGTFSGQGLNGTRGDVNFRIQGNDVVVTTPNNEFVTILKGGVNQNTSVKNALGKK